MLSPMLQCCTFNEQGNTGPLYQHFCKTVTQMTIISPNKQFLVVIPLLQLGELKSLHLCVYVLVSAKQCLLSTCQLKRNILAYATRKKLNQNTQGKINQKGYYCFVTCINQEPTKRQL